MLNHPELHVDDKYVKKRTIFNSRINIGLTLKKKAVNCISNLNQLAFRYF